MWSEIRNAYISFGKREGKRPLGNRERGWENDISMGLSEQGVMMMAEFS
jgi:hypothetical protein